MIWTSPIAWWIATTLLIVAELATGTFFLLMLALGTAAAALGAHLGLPINGQMTSGALVGGGAVLGWYLWRRRQPASPHVQEDRNVNLDIGSSVHVDHWEADGSTRLKYRGANWAARYLGQDAPQPGPHVIRKIEGSCLMLDR